MFTFKQVLLSALFLLVFDQAGAAPAQSGHLKNPTAPANDYEPGWVSAPKTRGTLGLIFSCVITLFLCAWTTIHVNIEPENEVNKTLSRAFETVIPGFSRFGLSRHIERLTASRVVRKLGWACVTLVIPEGIMAIATYERKTAYYLLKEVNMIIPKINGKINEKSPQEPPIKEWDWPLAYYAIMGGFVVPEDVYDAAKARAKLPEAAGDHIEADRNGQEISPALGSGSNDARTTNFTEAVSQSHGNISEDEISPPNIGKANNEEAKGTKGKKENKPLTLTPRGVLEMAKWQHEAGDERGLLSLISSDKVRDKSKANSLNKIIVVWQALWMIIQVIGRTADNLPVTLLELHTVLHTFCAVAMYITWWDKPVDIATPTTVPLHLDNPKDVQKVVRLVRGADNINDPTSPLNRNAGKDESSELEKAKAIPEEDKAATSSARKRAYLTSRAGLGKLLYSSIFLLGSDSKKKEFYKGVYDAYGQLLRGWHNLWLQALIISFVGLVYGGVHLAAWNNEFPSFAEQLLWKISAIITATAWGMFIFSLCLYPGLKQLEKKKECFKIFTSNVLQIGFIVCAGPVVLVRLYLLVESFVSIRKLPYGSYSLTSWANTWPHAS